MFLFHRSSIVQKLSHFAQSRICLGFLIEMVVVEEEEIFEENLE